MVVFSFSRLVLNLYLVLIIWMLLNSVGFSLLASKWTWNLDTIKPYKLILHCCHMNYYMNYELITPFGSNLCTVFQFGHLPFFFLQSSPINLLISLQLSPNPQKDIKIERNATSALCQRRGDAVSAPLRRCGSGLQKKRLATKLQNDAKVGNQWCD